MLWNLIVTGIVVSQASQPASCSAASAPHLDSQVESQSKEAKQTTADAMSRALRRRLRSQANHPALRMIAAKIRSCWGGFSDDPNRRMQQMLNTSEDLRKIEEEWSYPGWFTDQPSHLTYDRISGSLE